MLFARRDSFSTALAPGMSTQFENSMWVHVGNFRISFIASSVESDENGEKRIILTLAISQADLQYVTIFKSISRIENIEAVQILQPFNDAVVLNVLEHENGKIHISIFADKSGDRILEKAAIEY